MKAASILKLSGLKTWIGRPWSKGSLSGGLSAINEIAELFLYEKEKAKIVIDQSEVHGPTLDTSSTTPTIKTPEIKSPQNYFNTHFFQNDSELISESLLKEKFREDIKKRS